MASEDKPKTVSDLGAGIDNAAKDQAHKHGPSEAQQHTSKVKKAGKKSKGEGEIDNDTWKVIGGVVAVVAAVALGVTVAKKRGGKKEEAEEEAHGILDAAGKKLQSGGRWFGDKANVAQEKAGINAEKEGLKASEKSDAAVRDIADKIIHNTDKASTKVDNKSGGFFSGIGNWFRDRKDDTVDLVETASDKVKGKN